MEENIVLWFIESIPRAITNIKKDILDILPFIVPLFLTISAMVILLVLKELLGQFIKYSFKSVKIKFTEKPLWNIWHFVWFFIIFIPGAIGLVVSIDMLDAPYAFYKDSVNTPYKTDTIISKSDNLKARKFAIGMTAVGCLLIFQRLLQKLIRENTLNIESSNRKLLNRIWGISWAVVISICGVVGLSGSFETLGISAAIAGVLLGVSFQTPLRGVAGWVMLTVRKPFIAEDQIKIGSIKGKVHEINLMSITLKNTDKTNSDTVYIPNSTLFDQPIINYTNLDSKTNAASEET